MFVLAGLTVDENVGRERKHASTLMYIAHSCALPRYQSNNNTIATNLGLHLFLQKAPRPCCQSKLIVSSILVRDSFVVVVWRLFWMKAPSGRRRASQVLLFAGDWRWVSGSRRYRKPPMKRDSTCVYCPAEPSVVPGGFHRGPNRLAAGWNSPFIILTLWLLFFFFLWSRGSGGVERGSVSPALLQLLIVLLLCLVSLSLLLCFFFQTRSRFQSQKLLVFCATGN